MDRENDGSRKIVEITPPSDGEAFSASLADGELFISTGTEIVFDLSVGKDSVVAPQPLIMVDASRICERLGMSREEFLMCIAWLDGRRLLNFSIPLPEEDPNLVLITVDLQDGEEVSSLVDILGTAKSSSESWLPWRESEDGFGWMLCQN